MKISGKKRDKYLNAWLYILIFVLPIKETYKKEIGEKIKIIAYNIKRTFWVFNHPHRRHLW